MKQPAKKKRRQHDPVYRRIFNRAQIIEEILRRFATGPWASSLDFSTLESVPADFVSRYLKKRESDIIWRVRYGPGKDEWFYVFVLLELQSTVERFMALRLLGYILLLCEALISDKRMLPSRYPRLLPPVLPIVLYNGDKPWTAPRSLAALFKPMEGYTPPDFEYVVLDVYRYPPEELRPVEDVTSGVFLMEQADGFDELRVVADELWELIDDDPALEEDVSLLIDSVAVKLNVKDEEAPQARTRKEVSMLLERAAKWPQKWEAKGEAKGEARGEAKGEAKGEVKGRRLGKAETLKNLASHRFGELPAWAVERLDRADVVTLDRWSYRLLDATRLEDVFSDPD